MSNDAGALDLGGVDIGEAKVAANGGDVKSENLHVGVGLEVSNPIAPPMVDDFGVISHHNADGFSSFKTPGFSLSDSRFRIMAGVGVLVLLTFLLFQDDILDTVVESSIEPEEIVETQDLPAPIKKKPLPDAKLQEQSVVSYQDLVTNPVFTQNPYFFVENTLNMGNFKKDMLFLPPTLEHEWRQDLQHRYFNKRLNAIREIRRLRMKGSEILLFESLDQPKLWLRMEALIGLAEFGVKFGINTAQRAVSEARLSLQKNYFKRYQANLSIPERYTLTQLLKISQAPVRVQILANLLQNRDVESHLFVQAARFDQDPLVKNWFQKNVGQSSLLPGSLDGYRKAVERGYVKQLAAEESTVGADLVDDLSKINKESTQEFESDSSLIKQGNLPSEDDDIDEKIGLDGDDGFNDLRGDSDSAQEESYESQDSYE